MNPVSRLRLIRFDRMYDAHEITPFVAHGEISSGERSVGHHVHEFERAIGPVTLHQICTSMPGGTAESVVVKARGIIDNRLDCYVVLPHHVF